MRDEFKKLMLVFIVLHLFINCYGQINTEYSFEEYCIQFSKNYSDEKERDFRRQVFNRNYQRILDAEAQGNGTAHYEVNNFTDWTDEELAAYDDLATENEGLLSSSLPSSLSSVSTPSSLDYRTQGIVTEIKNQGKCGSCWAFSSTAAYESAILKQGGQNYDLAQSFALKCTPGSDCDGGKPQDAMARMGNGIPLESSYPYGNGYNSYSGVCNAANKIKAPKVLQSIYHYTNVSDSQLKAFLAQYGPVSIALNGDFFLHSYSSGLHRCPTNGKVNHAVLLVGYTSQGHWIIKNSWGTGWGDNGYATIHKDYCSIGSWVDVLVFSSEDSDGGDNAEYVEYRVEMTDSNKDGWHGLVLSIRQDNQIISSFGSQFTSGSSYTLKVNVMNNKFAQLIVTTYAYFTQQVGFKIYDQNNNLIYTRNAGSVIPAYSIIHSWCPGSSCVEPIEENVKVYMTDSYGDGWNGNRIGLVDSHVFVCITGAGFTSGHNYGPEICTVKRMTNIRVQPAYMGSYRNEVGFVITDMNGGELLRRNSGSYYQSNTLFGTFCLGCVNHGALSQSSDYGNLSQEKMVRLAQLQEEERRKNSPISKKVEEKQTYTTLTWLFASTTLVLAVCVIVLAILWKKSQRKIEFISEHNSTLGNININRNEDPHKTKPVNIEEIDLQSNQGKKSIDH